jgi:hypothetical protein
MEESVLKWFEDKGIRQTTPIDIIEPKRTTLKLKITDRVRKLSAPD